MMPIAIHQIVRSKRKTLSILIKNDGLVIVRAPLGTSDAAVEEFVQQHTAWIEKKQVQIRSLVMPPPKQYVPGEMFSFLGKQYPLEIVNGQKKALVLEGSFRMAQSARDRPAIVFERWY